jgi:hypothetical protein
MWINRNIICFFLFLLILSTAIQWLVTTSQWILFLFYFILWFWWLLSITLCMNMWKVVLLFS